MFGQFFTHENQSDQGKKWKKEEYEEHLGHCRCQQLLWRWQASSTQRDKMCQTYCNSSEWRDESDRDFSFHFAMNTVKEVCSCLLDNYSMLFFQSCLPLMRWYVLPFGCDTYTPFIVPGSRRSRKLRSSCTALVSPTRPNSRAKTEVRKEIRQYITSIYFNSKFSGKWSLCDTQIVRKNSPVNRYVSYMIEGNLSATLKIIPDYTILFLKDDFAGLSTLALVNGFSQRRGISWLNLLMSVFELFCSSMCRTSRSPRASRKRPTTPKPKRCRKSSRLWMARLWRPVADNLKTSLDVPFQTSQAISSHLGCRRLFFIFFFSFCHVSICVSQAKAKTVVVIGGGLSGLACGKYLSDAGHKAVRTSDVAFLILRAPCCAYIFVYLRRWRSWSCEVVTSIDRHWQVHNLTVVPSDQPTDLSRWFWKPEMCSVARLERVDMRQAVWCACKEGGPSMPLTFLHSDVYTASVCHRGNRVFVYNA